MIASLPMYWRAETAPLWQAFWHAVQTALPGLPDLMPPEALPADWCAHWLAPDLALSMTCGLPFRSALKGRVTYVGTLDFGLEDTPAGHYRSVRIEAPGRTGTRLAYNAADSQSGWAAACSMAPPEHWSALIETGAHAASLEAVARGTADVAFLDIVTWRLLERHAPDMAARVRVTALTEPTPALPLICAQGRDPAPLRRALRAACAGFAPADPMAMGGPLSFAELDPACYHAVPLPPAPLRAPD